MESNRMASTIQDRGMADHISTRWSLVERLKLQDPASWQEFARLYGRLIHCVATQTGCTREEAEDAVQETLSSVAREIHRFNTTPNRGSFSAWLLTIARRRIVDQLRKRPPEDRFVRFPGSTTATPTINRIPDLAADLDDCWDREWRHAVFQRAIEWLKTQVKPGHFKIFYLVVVKEQPVRDVAKTLNVSSAQVYLVKHRLSALLKRQVDQLDDGEPWGM